MSGGSFDYAYLKIRDALEGEFQDDTINEMFLDFCNLMHDLEWYQSCDISEEHYKETLKNFKKKWIKDNH